MAIAFTKICDASVIKGTFLCQMSQICSKMVTFLFSPYFGSHFCYHSKVKSWINTRLYTWVIVLINYQEETRAVQSVTCLATDACLTAIPGVASSIPARSHTFVEIDHEIISTVILLPSADSFKKGCCQLQAKVCARITGYPLVQACPGKSVVRWTDRPAMTIAVDLGRKATKQTNKPRRN